MPKSRRARITDVPGRSDGPLVDGDEDDEVMKASWFHRYGGPEVLVCEERPTPTPDTGEALVRVRAVGR